MIGGGGGSRARKTVGTSVNYRRKHGTPSKNLRGYYRRNDEGPLKNRKGHHAGRIDELPHPFVV